MAPELLVIMIVLITILFVIIVYLLSSRKYKIGEWQLPDLDATIQKLNELFEVRNWATRMDLKDKKIHIEKESKAAIDVLFERSSDQKVEVSFVVSTSSKMGLIDVFYGLFSSISWHLEAKDFGKKEVMPLLLASIDELAAK